MGILGRVIPVRLLKPFTRRDRDATQADITVRNRAPNHSIPAGISPIPMFMLTPATATTVTMNQQSDHPDCPSTSTPRNNPFLHRANNIARPLLNVLSPIGGGFPVVGTPLKASIDALLVVLNGIDKKSQNKENAAHLTRRLYRLRAVISAIPAATPLAQHQREELGRNIDAVSGRLERLHVDSVLRSADIAQAILDCLREIDGHELDYTVHSLMRIEDYVHGLPAFLDRQGPLPRSVQQGMVFAMDATGREFKVLVDQCQSRELFMGVLECYFGDDEKDRVLRDFMARGAYDLYIEGETGTIQLDGWSGVRAGTRIVMSAVLEDSRHIKKYRCPRCRAWNNCKEANDGWIDCVSYPGRFQITDADRRSSERSSKFGQNAQGSTTRSADDDRLRLDLILNFHLRQRDEDEEVFVQGLREYCDSPYAIYSQSRGRPRWRNQFLVDYLAKHGIERSKKQVASHIQVLRNMWKGEPEFALVAGGDELYPDSCSLPVKLEEPYNTNSLIAFDWEEQGEVFVQGLREYCDSPYAIYSQSLGRPRWRNQFLVDYLAKHGIKQSKKQVASHIQVLRNTWKGEPEFALIAGDDGLYPDSGSPLPVKVKEPYDTNAIADLAIAVSHFQDRSVHQSTV